MIEIDPKDPFEKHRYDHRATVMEVAGLQAILNMPKAIPVKKDADGNEITQGLPPYNKRPAFVVDEYPACPDSWMHGSGVASSYFVPIRPEHGMWLDFTMNSHHTHDVAIVPSIQGVNPLTGLKSDPIRLEQYKDKCPKHDVEFKQDRFCEKCNYKWHPQNYLCSNNGSPFWLDGFRSDDGTIRQWYFTEEECKGVAAQLIGGERVFAIGLAFYLSKEPKPVVTYRGYQLQSMGGLECLGAAPPSGTLYTNTYYNAMPASTSYSGRRLSASRAGTRSVGAHNVQEVQANVESTQKMLEIGAGAKIHQRVNPDPKSLDYWSDEPAGFIYINYCDIETAQKILAAGKREELAEGFLSNLNTK